VEIDGEDAADVAAGWIEANEAIWSEWFQEGPPPSAAADTMVAATTEA
jgi:hypothetical protein